MLYIRKFDTTAEFIAEKDNLARPNISFVEEVNDIYALKMPICKLKLNDNSVVELFGNGQLTQSMIQPYKDTVVSAETTNLCNSIGSYAFQGCANLKDVTIPDGSTNLSNAYAAFSGCSSLSSVTLPQSYSTNGIPPYMFCDCSSLTSIALPLGVTQINNCAFQNCSGLTSVVLPQSLQTIVYSAFTSCVNLQSIDIPLGVTAILDYSFYNCTSLTSINIPNSVTYISQHAFQYCTSLSEITIGSGIQVIQPYTFSDCTALSSITIPNNVVAFSAYSFYNCSSLSNITLPENIYYMGEGAFSGCTSLPIVNGVRYADKCAVELTNPESSGDLTFVEGTKWIGPNFSNAKGMQRNIIIPNSVLFIFEYAFFNMIAVSNITIGNSVKYIGRNAFWGCGKSRLKTLTIPNSVEHIESSAFQGLSKLSAVTIGSSVLTIEENAFASCTVLTSINILATTAPAINNLTFRTIGSNGTLTVPQGSTGYDTWMGTSAYYLGYYNWTKVEQ